MRYKLADGRMVQGDDTSLVIGEIQYLRGVRGIPPDERKALGITEVVEEPMPQEEFVDFSEDPENPGKWLRQPWAKERIQQTLIMEAQSARYTLEQSGFKINNFHILTDDRSKLMLMGAKTLAEADPSYVTQWANPDGSTVELQGAVLEAIAIAVAKFVDSCFAIYSEVAKKIETGEITTKSQVRDAFAKPEEQAG